MKSKRCLFNKAIFKSDIKRFLPFTIPLLIVDLIIFPIIVYSNFNLPNSPLGLDDFVGMSVAADVFNFIFSGAFALLMFSYLYKANRCNAIHAFPIGRKGLFISSYLAGYILLVVPQIIGFAVSIPGIYTTSKETAAILLLQFVSIFAESFIFYSIGVLAVMLAGNIFAGAVIYLIINLFTLVFEAVINLVLGRIGYGLSASESFSFGIFSFSPIAELITCKLSLILSKQDIVPSTMFENTLLELWGAYYPRIAALCVISVVLIIVAYLLYRIRKLECAGDMVSFKIEIPVISLIVAFFGGSLLSIFICIFVPFKLVGFAIAFVIFSFVSFIIAQMVLRKTPKIFNLRNIILWAVFCALTVTGLYALSVYKTNYIPKTNNVKTVTVNASYEMDIKDKEDIELVEKFHKALIENEKTKKRKTDDEFGNGLLGWFDNFYDYNYTVNLMYSLDNKKVMSRTYSFDKENKELVGMLYEIEGKYHPEGVFDKLEGINFEITNIGISGWSDGDGDFEDSAPLPEIPKSKYNELFEVIKEQHSKDLESYRTKPVEYGEDVQEKEEADKDFYYDVAFECRVTDKQSRKKLNAIDDYFWDQASARISLETEYTDNGWKIKDETESFNIVLSDIPSNSELFKMISSFDSAKKTA